MSWVRSGLVGLIAMGVMGAWAAPKIFICQYRAKVTDGINPNVTIDSYLAQELDNLGQVEPVVWSISDPVVRELVNKGLVPEEWAIPNPKNARQMAARVNADYFMEITAVKDGAGCKPTARLYRGLSTKPIWEFGKVRGREYRPDVLVDGQLDQEATKAVLESFNSQAAGADGFVVTVNGRPDWVSLGLTMARTWAGRLESSAFKNLVRRPKIVAPVSGSGYLITSAGVMVNAPEGEKLLPAVEDLISRGREDLAIIVLRDGIDKEPFEPDRRVYLAELLLNRGHYRAAAEESERAARLMQGNPDLWLSAARSWFLDGNAGKAQEAVNQALARGASGSKSLILLGDVYVMQGDYVKAVTAYGESIAQGPRPRALLGRAMAYAMAGEAVACEKDLAALVDVDPEEYLLTYQFAMGLTGRRFEGVAANLRDGIPLLRLNRRDPAAITKVSAAAKAAEGLSELIDSIPVPERHIESHQSRVLAHKLLLQSAQEVLEFAKTADSNLAEESLISLGEAAGLMPDVMKAFAVERNLDNS